MLLLVDGKAERAEFANLIQKAHGPRRSSSPCVPHTLRRVVMIIIGILQLEKWDPSLCIMCRGRPPHPPHFYSLSTPLALLMA